MLVLGLRKNLIISDCMKGKVTSVYRSMIAKKHKPEGIHD